MTAISAGLAGSAGSTVEPDFGMNVGIMKSSLTQPVRKKAMDTTVPILESHDGAIGSVLLNRGRRGVRSLLAVEASSP